jgi:hypothetical protein
MLASHRPFLGVALLTASSLHASFARASSGSEDKRAQADAEFAEAKVLMDAGQTSAACARFARSQDLDPRLGRLLNLAFCHEQEGKIASAWREYTEATTLAEQKGQAEREDFAHARASAVARKLAFVLFDFPRNAAAAEIDGAALAVESWAFPVPLDPGDHAVSLTAPGKRPLHATVTVPTGPSMQHLAFASLEDESSSSPAAVAAADVPASRGASSSRAPAYVASGVAVAALAVGAGFAADAISKKGAADPHCPGRQCDPEGSMLVSQARSSATVSTVGFGVAGAGAVVALWLFLRPQGRPDAAAWAAPILDARTAGLRVGGSF